MAAPAGARGVVARLAVVLVAGAVIAPATISAQTLHVGEGRAHATIASALALSAPGDTVVVHPGTYRENLRIDRATVLIGDGDPVIDGGGRGHVIEARAPLSLSGFAIRGSGSDVDNEDAGVMAIDAAVDVTANRFEDVLYGVYVKNGTGSVIRGNAIRGKPLALTRRGDGIRLWYSSDSRIEENDLESVRDLVVYFSDRLVMRNNRVAGSRYGLHYMYSNDSRIEENRLAGNDVGAFLMYSAGLDLSDNVFEGNRGTTGMGLGLKDADDVRVIDNLFVDNGVALHLDNSPHSLDRVNRFVGNAFVANELGVRLLPSVSGNRFEENVLSGNGSPVAISGGARGNHASRNRWADNAWSEYRGFDENGDGVGDTPFVHRKLSDHLIARHPALGVFSGSPALSILDRASAFFPLLRPAPAAVDSSPRVSLPDLDAWAIQGVETHGTRFPWVVGWTVALTIVVGSVTWIARKAP